MTYGQAVINALKEKIKQVKRIFKMTGGWYFTWVIREVLQGGNI